MLFSRLSYPGPGLARPAMLELESCITSGHVGSTVCEEDGSTVIRK